MKDSIDIEKITEHWINTSDKDFQTMEHLYKSKDNNWALFMGHIVIEKLLKACVTKTTAQHAPLSHDLLRLATLAKIELNPNIPIGWMSLPPSTLIQGMTITNKTFIKSAPPNLQING